MSLKTAQELDRDQLLTAYLSQHDGMEFREWTRNGRAKVVDSETGEVSSLTQRDMRNEVANMSDDALAGILSAAIPEGVAETAGGGDEDSRGAATTASAASGAAGTAAAVVEAPEGDDEDGEAAFGLSGDEGGSEGEGEDATTAAGVESTEVSGVDADGEASGADAEDSGADGGDEADGAEAESEGEAQAEEQEGEGEEGEGVEPSDTDTGDTDAEFAQRLQEEGGSLAEQLAALANSFKEHNRHEKRGSLAKGGDLYNIDQVTQQMKEQGLLKTKEDVAAAVRSTFSALGMNLPGPSQRSQMKTTYEAWVVNTGAQIDQEFTSDYWTDEDGNPVTITPDSGDLMPLRMTDIGDYRMLERTKHIVTPQNMPDLLAFLKMNSWLVIAGLKKHLTADNLDSIMKTFQGMDEEGKLAWIARQEGVEYKKPSEWGSINVARVVFDKFMDDTIPALTRVIAQATPEKIGEEGEEPRISKTVAMEFLNELHTYFSEDVLVLIAKHLWGTMSPEEFKQLFGQSPEEYAAATGDIAVADDGPTDPEDVVATTDDDQDPDTFDEEQEAELEEAFE